MSEPNITPAETGGCQLRHCTDTRCKKPKLLKTVVTFSFDVELPTLVIQTLWRELRTRLTANKAGKLRSSSPGLPGLFKCNVVPTILLLTKWIGGTVDENGQLLIRPGHVNSECSTRVSLLAQCHYPSRIIT